MSKRGHIVFLFLIVTYGAVCSYILTSFLFHDLVWKDGEIYTIFFLKMSIISFPIGIVASTVGDYICSFIKIDQKITGITLWALMTITGGLQWFYLIPRCYKFLEQRMRKRGPRSES